MKVTNLISGNLFTLKALVINDVCLIENFIISLDEKDKNQVMSLLRFISDNGPPHNREKFRKIHDSPIFEVKTRGGLRILCFFSGERTIVLTHGFPKPKKKELRNEIDKAVKWHNEIIDLSDIKAKTRERRGKFK